MITPQELEQISFGKQTFGGYDMQQVDDLLGRLLDDYVALYKENALLKSKMRVLVSKLEDYRKNEASMKEAIAETQHNCDQMLKDTELKCAQMLSDANVEAAECAKKANEQIAAEEARVEEARQAAAAKIGELEYQLRSCLETLWNIKENNRPAKQKASAFDYDRVDHSTAVADEISKNLEAQVGYVDTDVLKADTKVSVTDSTVKFSNLQFGRNYDPNHK